MKATLNFQNNKQAVEFSLAWSRATTGGHTLKDTYVTVYNIDAKGKAFIDAYVNNLNK